jgi:hypothetical protein
VLPSVHGQCVYLPMRQSKSLGQLVGPPVSGALKRKSATKEAPEPVLPAAADAYELLEDCGRGCR